MSTKPKKSTATSRKRVTASARAKVSTKKIRKADLMHDGSFIQQTHPVRAVSTSSPTDLQPQVLIHESESVLTILSQIQAWNQQLADRLEKLEKRHAYTFVSVPTIPLWVRGCRIGPTYPPACRKRRLIGGSLFAVGCDPCQWKRGSWLLSQYFVAALRRQYTALASISLSRKVKMAWLNQSAGSAKP